METIHITFIHSKIQFKILPKNWMKGKQPKSPFVELRGNNGTDTDNKKLEIKLP